MDRKFYKKLANTPGMTVGEYNRIREERRKNGEPKPENRSRPSEEKKVPGGL